MSRVGLSFASGSGQEGESECCTVKGCVDGLLVGQKKSALQEMKGQAPRQLSVCVCVVCVCVLCVCVCESALERLIA